VLRSFMVVAASAAFMVVGYALISGLVDRRSLIWGHIPFLAATEVLYALILATFVMPGLAWLERRMVSLQESVFRGI